MCIVFAMPELYGEDDKLNKILQNLRPAVFLFRVVTTFVSVKNRNGITEVNPFFPIVVA